jgi:DNA-binding FrmR family transcriptional regulator
MMVVRVMPYPGRMLFGGFPCVPGGVCRELRSAAFAAEQKFRSVVAEPAPGVGGDLHAAHWIAQRGADLRHEQSGALEIFMQTALPSGVGSYTHGGYASSTLRGYSMEQAAARKVGTALKRIEGQIRGVQKMVEEDRYCIDVVTQIEAVRAALARVESDLLRQHLQHCVHKAMHSNDADEQSRVIDELVGVFKRQN